MHPARIAELLQPFLHDAQDQRPSLGCADQAEGTNDALYKHISTYIDILLRWNARISLTAIRDEQAIVTRHFGESLFAARQLFPRSCSVPALSGAPVSPVPSVVKDLDSADDRCQESNVRLADLGSGAGFPGIPIKLWAPDIALTLIESNQKKVAFLREVARSLTLTNINIQNTRAEDVAETFDVVTLRAVERFADILPIAANLVAPGARLALLISAPQAHNARAILPQLTWQDPIPIPQSESRTLLIGNQNKKSKQVG
jgi:16S rRNA (guanine527-N7)-methyltransferase